MCARTPYAYRPRYVVVAPFQVTTKVIGQHDHGKQHDADHDASEYQELPSAVTQGFRSQRVPLVKHHVDSDHNRDKDEDGEHLRPDLHAARW